VNLSSPANVHNSAMHSMAAYVLAVGANHPSIARVCQYHAHNVNPSVRTMFHTTFDALGKHVGGKFNYLAAAVVMAGYSGEEVRCQVRPSPDVCNLLAAAEICGLAAGPDQAKTFTYVEAALRAVVDTHVPVLAGACAQTQADDMVNALFIQVARMVWGKKWAPVFPVKDLSVGKPTEEKLAALIKVWVRWVDLKLPSAKFAAINGVEPVPSPSAAVDLASQTFDLPSLAQGPLQVGEQVVVTKRFTVPCPLKGEPAFKIDLQKGHEAFISCVRRLAEGYVTLKITKTVKGIGKIFDADVLTTNLERPSSAPAQSSGSATASAKPEPAAAPVRDAAPAWTKRADLPDGKLAKGWHSLLALDHDTTVAIAKQWATASMAMVAGAVPTYTSKDFLVLKRGAAVEVWTLREFKKHEICFAPVTSFVRDSYWTVGRSVLLRGSSSLHPSNKHLVLDGRTRTGIPTDKDAKDGVATFSFFWSVERTDAPELANLQLEYPTLDVAASVTLPGKKAAVVDATPAQVLVPPRVDQRQGHPHARPSLGHERPQPAEDHQGSRG